MVTNTHFYLGNLCMSKIFTHSGNPILLTVTSIMGTRSMCKHKTVLDYQVDVNNKLESIAT